MPVPTTPARRKLVMLSSLALCGLLAGVVVAASSFPAVAMAGLAAKAGSEQFGALPAELARPVAPQVTRIFASDGRTQIAAMYDEFRSDVPLADISVNMQNAIVAAEDHKFYQHNGVDLKGVVRAFVNNNQGGSQQGASTLTMQYVRMTLAYAAKTPQQAIDASRDTPERKLAEMKYALQVEKELSKKQILERYLNMAPFGNGAYGIYAGSEVYFKKKPADLTVAEAALLAGMVKAPTSFDPTTKTGYPQALDRRNYIIDNMRTLGSITPAAAAAAKATPLKRTTNRPGNGCVAVAKNSWGFFCDYFLRWWLSQPAFGANTYDRERLLKTGGYRVVTSLDVKAQASADKEIGARIADTNHNALVLAGVEPATGHVRTLATNRSFDLDDPAHPQNKLSADPELADKGVRGSYPKTTNPIITGGGDITGYQGGSAFKLFTMVAALESGIGLDHTINTQARYQSHYIIDPSSPAACPGTHFYCPKNASASEAGPFNMWTGFGKSVNTYFVPLEEQVGAQNAIAVAKRFGIRFRAQQDAALAGNPTAANQWGAFTLGVSNTTPLDVAGAYATLAADGMYCAPTPIQQLYAADGSKLAAGQPSCKRATSITVAREALDAARCPVGDHAQLGSCAGGTAPGARAAVGHPIFGKTATTEGDKTAGLVVGTQQLVVAGYLVDPDWANHTDHMDHGIVNPAVYETVADYMAGKPFEEFSKPD